MSGSIEINRSCKRNFQHWVLWLEGASVAYRTSSFNNAARSLVFTVTGIRNWRAACSCLAPDEQLINSGVAVPNAAALNIRFLRFNMT